MKKFGIIYKIKNLINGKIYIGQTKRAIQKRWAQHCKMRKDMAIGNAINKYGKENFEISIVCHCETQEELNHREAFCIKKFNSMSPKGYNLKAGGEGNVYSDESKKKMSISHKGKILTPEHKKRISDWFLKNGHPDLGIKKPGTSAKLKETFSKIKHPKKGKTVSIEGRKRIALGKIGDRNPMYGKTPNNRQLLGLEIGRQQAKDKTKKIICHQNGVVYSSTKEAARILGFSRTSITNVLTGHRKNCSGLTFEYIKNE
jgi:group I intron endonuclease